MAPKEGSRRKEEQHLLITVPPQQVLGWLRNLTMEGIEPNPGPTFNDFVKSLKQNFKEIWDSDFEVLVHDLKTEGKTLSGKKVPPLATVKAILEEGTSKALEGWEEEVPIFLQILQSLQDHVSGPLQQVKPSLEDLVNKIHETRPKWRSTLDVPEPITNVRMKMKWTGRTNEMELLNKSAMRNIDSHLSKQNTKQENEVTLIHGGIGVGKSRLGIEFNQQLAKDLATTNPTFSVQISGDKFEDRKFGDLFGGVANVFIDFSLNDPLSAMEVEHKQAHLIMGLRLASHYFFGVPVADLMTCLANIKCTDSLDLFTWDDVTALISKKFSERYPGKRLLITIQMDEFQKIPLPILSNIISLIGRFMTSQHDRGICLLPQLTGTSPTIYLEKANDFSRLTSVPLLLTPLEYGEDLEIMKRELGTSIIADHLESNLFLQVMDSLGRVPRFIQYFVESFKKHVESRQSSLQNLESVLSEVLLFVQAQIRDRYLPDKWESEVFTAPKEDIYIPWQGLRQMLIWALAEHTVSLNDKLNGITVDQARKQGILMLKEVPREPNKFTIVVPLALLRAINSFLHDIDDNYLNPIRHFNDSDFEKAMLALRVLRQNLLVGLGKKSARYSELYPHAIGHPEDLQQEVSIKHLTLFTLKAAAWQHAIHNHDPTKIPVVGVDNQTVNLREGGAMLINGPQAPSYDGVLTHPPDDIEGFQTKSSAHIALGKEPRQKVDIKLIQEEYKKCIQWDTFHKLIFPNYRFKLAFISNKPLKRDDKMKLDSDINTLPKGIFLVTHENFPKYAACFAHRGFYQPLIKKSLFPNPINHRKQNKKISTSHFFL